MGFELGPLNEPPEPPRNVSNPFASTASAFALALTVGAAGCLELAAATSNAGIWLAALALLVVLPACTTLMGFADSGIAGLNPRAIGDLIAKAGVAYVPFALCVNLGYGLLFVALRHTDRLLFLALLGAAYGFLVTQTLADESCSRFATS